jgi:6,7-dimethyl-8-ribityllumazine synthase
MASKIMILEHRLYSDISDALLKGALSSISQQGVECSVIPVPELYDLPVVIRYNLRSMELRVNESRYMGYVLLGCMPFDEGAAKYGYKDIICDIERLKLKFSIAVGTGIIDTRDRATALRIAPDMGREAAVNCFKLLSIKRSLGL